MASSYAPVLVRVSTPADIEEIVATMTTAFFDDPLWGPAFPDVERRVTQASAMWRLFVTSSLRYPWTLVAENIESAAPWFPPSGAELTEDEQSVGGMPDRYDQPNGCRWHPRDFRPVRGGPPKRTALLPEPARHSRRPPRRRPALGLLKEISRALTPSARPLTWSRATRPTTRGTRASASLATPRSRSPRAMS